MRCSADRIVRAFRRRDPPLAASVLPHPFFNPADPSTVSPHPDLRRSVLGRGGAASASALCIPNLARLHLSQTSSEGADGEVHVDQFTATWGDAGTWFGLPAGIFPPHGQYRVPSRADCGLEDAQEFAEQLHSFGNTLLRALDADREDPAAFAADYGGQDLTRWVEIGEIVRAAGAAIELVLASICEVQGLLKATDQAHPGTSPLVAGFVTEGAAQYLVSVGHSLTNAAWRICLTSPATQARLAAHDSRMRRSVRATIPGATTRDAWLFHSAAEAVAVSLSESRTTSARFMKTMARLHSAPDWQAASNARGRYFHRLRAGLAAGTEDEFTSAWDFHLASLKAAQCLGRAIPSIYNDVVDSVPRQRRGARRGAPLLTAPLVSKYDPIEREMSEAQSAVPRRAFRR